MFVVLGFNRQDLQYSDTLFKREVRHVIYFLYFYTEADNNNNNNSNGIKAIATRR